MEAAVRWSPHSGSAGKRRFLIADVTDPGLTLHEVDTVHGKAISYHAISKSGRVPKFEAFDCSKTNESLVALGHVSGSATLLRLREGTERSEMVASYRMKQERKCNSISLSTQDWLAVGVDRARSDICLYVYDVGREQGNRTDAVRRLCAAEAVSSVRFFPSHPQEIVASTQKSYIRLYDLRESSATSNLQASTRNVNNISIDPLDQNYFASGGSSDDPSVTVWDRRLMSSSPASGSTSGMVFDFRPAVNNSSRTSVWSLRYSAQRRGRLAICASTGELLVIDTAENKVSAASADPPAGLGVTTAWSSNRYVSETRVVEHPWHDSRRGREMQSRIIAFDWMDTITPTPVQGQSVLVLRPNRQVDVLQVPIAKPLATVTPRGDMSIDFGDLTIMQPESRTGMPPRKSPYERSNGTHAEDFGPHQNPSEDDTEEFDEPSPRESTKIAHLLAKSATHADRCRRGYLFDCEKNLEIVAGEWQLERLWEIVKRFKKQAADDGMLNGGLDLSYLGVNSLWSELVGSSPHRRTSGSPLSVSDAINGLNAAQDLPPFEGERTGFPEHRQLCLAVCGWKFSIDSLEEECQELIERGLHYQAIVQAVLHGYTHIALNLLRTLIRSNTIPNIGLGALLASTEINAEQREMCLWMTADTEDPALKALLAYLISGNWRDVMKTNYLHLGYRVALGLKYLNDTELSGFIQTETARAIKNGDLEGILLTGLSEQAMDLFQTYINRTNDLQTAVLATAFTNPLYVDDVRWEMWKETYFQQMQAWRCFIPRTKFTVQHNRMARTREGRCLIEPPKAQLTLRCLHCQGDLAQRSDSRYLSGRPSRQPFASHSTNVRVQLPPAQSGTVCPHCGRHMPRCALCQMWLGTPNPSTAGGARELQRVDVMAKLISFCKRCGHAFHADHAKSWFGNGHKLCPVPDCRCACGLAGG